MFTWFLKNNQTYIEDGRLNFRLKCFGGIKGYTFKTNVRGRLIAVRFVPTNDYFTLEIIYEKEIQENIIDNNRVCSIDLGVNNFITLTNNVGSQPIIKGKGIKSINQYYNKQVSKIKSIISKRNGLHWCKKLDVLSRKRYNKLHNLIHHCSKFVVNYCINNNVKTLVAGLNKEWKQECSIGKRNNQNFVYIPYNKLIEQLEYKCQDNNIKLIVTEEKYTSGTSFLDDELPIKENYNK